MARYIPKNIKILGSAVSIGQPKKGVENTPIVLKNEKIEKLMQTNAQWVGIVNQPRYTIEKFRAAPIRNLPELAKTNKSIYDAILKHSTPDNFFLTIGGDHSIASSTVAAQLKVHKNKLAVIWIDAHGDYNTPLTSPSGNYHGMPLAHALGLFKEPQYFDWGQDYIPLNSIAMIGIRDLDSEEKLLMDSTGLLYYTMTQIKEKGMRRVISDIMKRIDPLNDKMLHVSLDVDGFDPSLFPGTGTAVPGGLDFNDYKVIMSKVRGIGERFVSMDIVEVNLGIEKDITLMNVKEIIKHTFT